ncbi:flagellar export chaperone FlgN [Anaeromyxobacter paludicola]|uniref:FlgN family protein n=1 Tax=Anaeromyxobacter paludicola TaxID=2918171 RepID=A0ABN6N4S6_9BACT|nr:flagellar export chaperone FlgN [Anaeromyxobacter paludicola]BDG08011.1 hypothetical protein AMPC_11240 [Anaeromyxobacter paludicola]
MSKLDDAAHKAEALRALLAAEIERARGERELMRSLDADGLFARAAARSAFNGEVGRIEGELARSLSLAAGALGAPEVTLERLRERAPAETERLSTTLGEIRALAEALGEIDALNRTLCERALTCVRGYVRAVRPAPAAYDRRGARPESRGAAAMISSKG